MSKPHISEEGSHSARLRYRGEMTRRLRRNARRYEFVNELSLRDRNVAGMNTSKEGNRRTVIENPHQGNG